MVSTNFAQGIYSVNNNIGISADFANLQSAIDSVPANSILLVHGSSISHGNITVGKPLSIIGTGYFLGSNQAPYTQANLGTAKVEKLTLSSGSTGTLISGLTINNNLAIESTSNVTISRNLIKVGGRYIFITNSSNVLFTQNYSTSLIAVSDASTTISNNIFVSDYQSNSRMVPFDFSSSNATISNNIFDRLNNDAPLLNLKNGSTVNFSNNIHISHGRDNTSIICGTCPGGGSIVATNNVSSDSSFANTNNSIFSQGIETIFPQYNSSNSSLDSKYILTNGSPAIGAGTGNIDAGIFAGNNSYVLSGIPFIPNIYGLEVPNIGTTGNGLKIRIKAQANQ